MTSELKFGKEVVKRGTRRVVRIPITNDLNGSPIALTVHALAGVGEGPTLSLLCALHGCEWLPVEFLRRLVERVKVEELKGNLMVVPVANPVAFATGTRDTVDESDSPDLNRSFPGTYNWIAEQLARALVDEVLAQTGYMMDFHGGGPGRVMGDVTYGYDYPDPKVVEASKEMAKAYGWPLIRRADICANFPGPKSSFGYAGGVMNIPNIGPEIGGAGFDEELEEYWIETNVKGVMNVMKHLGMLPGKVEYLEKYLLWEKRWRVTPSVGGYLLPEFKVRDHTKEVVKGQVLARVVSPYTFEELEVLRSPGDGVVFYCPRSQPVRPGFWGFGVIDIKYPGTRWVAPNEF